MRRFLPTLPALALSAFLATVPFGAPEAHAQAMRLPGPVTAAQLERALTDAGLTGKARDQALLLHEAYFENFRAFEDREVVPSLDQRRGDFDMARSSEDARKDASTRRRLLARAAQLDNGFVDELMASLTGDDQLRAEALRTALARRRSAALLPQMGPGSRIVSFDLRSAPVLATLEPAVRDAIRPALDAYDADLTRLVERAGQAALDRSVRAAELRETRAVAGTPPVVEGDGAAPDQASVDTWFREMQALSREASQDLVDATARLRKLHRDTLASIEPSLPALAAFDLRAHLLSGAYPMTVSRRPFAAVVEALRAKRESGGLGGDAWTSALDLVAAHESSMRTPLEAMLAAADAVPDPGEMIFIDGNDREETPEAARLARAKEAFLEADARGADALRATLGLEDGSKQAGRVPPSVEINGASIDLGQILGDAVGGGGDGGGFEVTGGVQIVVGAAGGGEGDMIVLGGDDLEGSGMVFMGGPVRDGMRMPKPMTRGELDDLFTTSGSDAALRTAFDTLADEMARERADATEGLVSEPMTLEGEGSMSFTIAVGEEGAAFEPPSPERIGEARARIDASEEAFFDGVKAIAAGDRLDEVERARRIRARARLATGERGAAALDPVAVALVAAIDDRARATALTALEGWDLASVDLLRGARRELDALNAEQAKLFEEATVETVEETADGATSVSRQVAFDGDLGARIEEVGSKSNAVRERVERANRDAVAGALAALDADPTAARTLRRAFQRGLHPSVYARFDSLRATFAKARELVTDAALATVLDSLEEEWRETREARCDEAVAEIDARAAKPAAGVGGFDIADLQARTRESRRLRGDLTQIDSAIHRRIVDLVTGAVGADLAKTLPPAPGARGGARPMIQFGS